MATDWKEHVNGWSEVLKACERANAYEVIRAEWTYPMDGKNESSSGWVTSIEWANRD